MRGTPAPWLTSDLRHLIVLRDKMYKKAKRSGRASDLSDYKGMKNRVNYLCRQAKKDHAARSVIQGSEGGKAGVWKAIRTLLPNKTTNTVTYLEHEGQSISDSKGLAETFKDFFHQVIQDLCSTLSGAVSPYSPTQFINKVDSTFSFTPLTVESVTDQLSMLNVKKATGLDSIDNRLLKAGAQVLAPSLTNLFNKSLSSGEFPTKWKMAKVMPIHKKGDRTMPSNYRPVSILPGISKILERAVHNQLYTYFNQHQLLSQCQSGFRKRHSCETALHLVTEDWIESINKKQKTGVIFCDLSRAFDTLNHDIMLSPELLTSTCNLHLLAQNWNNTVWDQGGKGCTDKLQKLQNRAGRVILGCDRYTSSETVLNLLGWTTVSQHHTRAKAVLTFKALNGMTPAHISQYFTTSASTHSHNTRHSTQGGSNYLKHVYSTKRDHFHSPAQFSGTPFRHM
ncbi:hypothetical protein Bbelb_373900 [Branchiostoma belcheri]|nr:hypothetical protein Bbelb_373900 [Branchiostoma belcheri]